MATSFYALNQENFAGRTYHFLNQGNWCLYGAADANRRNLEKEQGRLLARLM